MWTFVALWLVAPFAVVFRGVALAQMWAWFVAPLGVRPIGIAWGIALAATARCFVERQPDYAKLEREGSERYGVSDGARLVITSRMRRDLAMGITGALMGPLMTLAFGGLLHQFVDTSGP